MKVRHVAGQYPVKYRAQNLARENGAVVPDRVGESACCVRNNELYDYAILLSSPGPDVVLHYTIEHGHRHRPGA